MRATLPYGAWPSPLTPALVTGASARFDGARFVGDEVWWAQSVPEEGGRMTVRARAVDGTVRELLPAPGNARSSVHEYGGGAWAATDAGELVFVERADQRVWILRDGAARPLTPAELGMRFGGLSVQHGRLLAVRETHAADGAVTHGLVIIPLDGAAAEDAAALQVLVDGSGFVAQPALAPDAERIAWIAWEHPAMPWDGARLRVCSIETGTVEIAGTGTALQPTWTGPDELTFLDDATGRWNLARVRPSTGAVTLLAPAEADTGGALWVLGTRWYGMLGDGRIAALRTNGSDELVVIDPATGEAERVDVPVSSQVVLEDARGTHVLLTGAGAAHPSGLWLVDVTTGEAEALAGGRWPWDAAWLPRARAFTARGPHGPVHAFDFPPTSPEAEGPAGELPPYIVLVHGGPTSHVGGAPSATIAFLTSRGIGVLDVNYGGSTGYGRGYRERLRGQWGVVDVDDVAAAARALAREGRADGERLAIEGGSAGGWTVLGALARTDTFAAGISRYGVGDARALAADTHDFESRYLDGLIGPLPEAEPLYLERSPLMHVDRIRVPMLIMQGTDDAVVPPSQSEAIVRALAARGIPHEYVLYEGEGHGFRRADTMQDVLTRELSFLGQTFGFTPAPSP
ncbi:prolyl oligopeptidase family serine peptidase [Microbacterium sp. X-17]|uniref:S9 family peptidase n=1 Tax=Microbacterium sp. X-17 TaxID=3144404 RepID=UPI0031F48C19